MQVRYEVQSFLYRLKVGVKFVRQPAEGLKGSDVMSKTQKQIVRHGEQSTLQGCEHRQFIVGPLNRVQCGPQTFHFFTLMEGSCLPELVRDVSGFQRVDVVAGQVCAEGHESLE